MKKFKQYIKELDTSKMPRIPDSDIEDARKTGQDTVKRKSDWEKGIFDTIKNLPKSSKEVVNRDRNIDVDSAGLPHVKDIPVGQRRGPQSTTPSQPKVTQAPKPAPAPAPAPSPKPAPAPVPKTAPAPAPKVEPKKNDGYLTSIRPNNPLSPDELRKPAKNWSNQELDNMFKESTITKVLKILDELDMSKEKPDYSNIEDKRQQAVTVGKTDKWTGSSAREARPMSKGEILGYNKTSTKDKSEVEDLTKR